MKKPRRGAGGVVMLFDRKISFGVPIVFYQKENPCNLFLIP